MPEMSNANSAGCGKLRIVLVGPVLPLRSGIAQHTTMLHRALASKCDLKTLSFARQYPNWLYPGRDQTEPGLDDYREAGVEYDINGLNPLTWRTAVRRILAFAPDAVIIPWWTVYWAPWSRFLAAGMRAAGTQVVFVAHNVVDHETAAWKRWLTRHVLGAGDHILVHTHAAEEDLTRLLGGVLEVSVHPHPIYSQFPADIPSPPRRAALELLFFGFVRDYKGLDVLLKALAGLDRSDWHLSIVGEFWKAREAICRVDIERLGLAERIELVPRYVTATEAARYFGRADLVVLPYRHSSGTGIVPLAYHYNKPVVVSNIGALAETVRNGRTGWLFDEGSPNSLRETLAPRSAQETTAMATAITELKTLWTWDNLAETLLRIVARCTSR